jgi:osmotically-inducible protein OsmY
MKVKPILVGMGLLAGSMGWMSARSFADDVTPKQADNSQINQRDRNASEPTADNAKNTKSDLQTMQQIRKSIVADKSLSTYAHNVKVVSENGHVTLKGTVHTEAEKSNIEAKACAVAGTENVTNNITVKGS